MLGFFNPLSVFGTTDEISYSVFDILRNSYGDYDYKFEISFLHFISRVKQKSEKVSALAVCPLISI